MDDVFLPFPGLALGAYPEREEADTGMVAGMDRLLAGWRRKLALRPARLHRFVTSVNGFEVGLGNLSAAELDAQVRVIRAALAREGFTESLAAEAFAVIRETSRRVLGLRHFDTQLMGGWLMLNGVIAEMETGEGKTLTATLPVCTAALAGVPVHVVTVNDYLVDRDAEFARPLCQALGLSVGVVVEGMEDSARRQAYHRDVTYCCNKQLVFDYLRDRLLPGRKNGRLQTVLTRLSTDHGNGAAGSSPLLRGLNYAIVDEADSVLIDEARTPLVISREQGVAEQQAVYHQALAIAAALKPESDFLLNHRERKVQLTVAGARALAEAASRLGGVWLGQQRQRELTEQALSALHLFERDKHYLVRDGKIQIIDEFTGRTMADRSWEHGLHQMVEAKEGCPLTLPRETLARISYQQFFRRYHRLGGMTGTAAEVRKELQAVYGLEVVPVPTHRPVQRVRLGTRVYQTADQKWQAVVRRIEEIHAGGQPILVGTRSVAASEHLSERLQQRGVTHQVLNARQDADEATLVAQAGQIGQITVATNMAGRGTDIKLGPGVAERGGLSVIATEMHESARIDRQLFGRSGRQGDPGCCEMVIALDDELATLYGPGYWVLLIQRFAQRLGLPLGERFALSLMRSSQRRAEFAQSQVRRNLLKNDKQMRRLLAFSGRAE